MAFNGKDALYSQMVGVNYIVTSSGAKVVYITIFHTCPSWLMLIHEYCLLLDHVSSY